MATKHQKMIKELNEVLIEHNVSIWSDQAGQLSIATVSKGLITSSTHNFFGHNPHQPVAATLLKKKAKKKGKSSV